MTTKTIALNNIQNSLCQNLKKPNETLFMEPLLI